MTGGRPLAGWAAGPVGALVAALATLPGPAPLPDIPAVALYAEPPLLAGWVAPLAGALAAGALGLRSRRWAWAAVVGALLALASPGRAMPLALVALSLAALPGPRRQG